MHACMLSGLHIKPTNKNIIVIPWAVRAITIDRVPPFLTAHWLLNSVFVISLQTGHKLSQGILIKGNTIMKRQQKKFPEPSALGKTQKVWLLRVKHCHLVSSNICKYKLHYDLHIYCAGPKFYFLYKKKFSNSEVTLIKTKQETKV